LEVPLKSRRGWKSHGRVGEVGLAQGGAGKIISVSERSRRGIKCIREEHEWLECPRKEQEGIEYRREEQERLEGYQGGGGVVGVSRGGVGEVRMLQEGAAEVITYKCRREEQEEWLECAREEQERLEVSHG
jgi:hypothetical protein